MQESVAVLFRTSPALVWSTVDNTEYTVPSEQLFSRIHSIKETSSWVLGGTSELLLWDGTTFTEIEWPEDSLISRDLKNHPWVSLGYSNVSGDLDGDSNPDWLVGAPTAGSGSLSGFPKQAGWVGWLEFNGTQWELQREWTGNQSYSYFGWALEMLEEDSQHLVFAGIPGQDKVQNIITFEKIQINE